MTGGRPLDKAPPAHQLFFPGLGHPRGQHKLPVHIFFLGLAGIDGTDVDHDKFTPWLMLQGPHGRAAANRAILERMVLHVVDCAAHIIELDLLKGLYDCTWLQ